MNFLLDKLSLSIIIIARNTMSWKKLLNVPNLFNLLLTIIIDNGQQNAHTDSEVVSSMLTTTIEQ